MRPDAEIEACRASHRRLLAVIAPLEDGDFRAPSALPRWTRGHVVTHLPERADHADLLAWLIGRASAPDLGPW